MLSNIIETREVWIVRHIESGKFVRTNGGIGDICLCSEQHAKNLGSLIGYEALKATCKIEFDDIDYSKD